MIEYDKFRMSLERLEEQYKNYRERDDSLPELTREAITESVIRRFKTCYDCLWKVLKRYLIEELGLADVSNSPKPIFRLASENESGCLAFGGMVALRRLPAMIRPTTTAHSEITPPLRGSRQGKDEVRSRAGGGTNNKPAWTSWIISSTTPSASTRP